jgi:hypothetical protein
MEASDMQTGEPFTREALHPALPARSCAPATHQGVWVRKLLETPLERDTDTWTRWIQTARWQACLTHDGERAAECASEPQVSRSVLQTPDRLVQFGMNERHLAVWERLPGSQGRRIVLARRDARDRPTHELLLMCGDYLLHRAPRADASPPSPVLRYGRIDAVRGVCTIERASDPALDGLEHPWHLERLGLELARICAGSGLGGAWEVLEWSEC